MRHETTARRKISCFALCVLILALGLSAEAQQPEKIARVGFLGVSASRSADRTNSFRQGLRELGYAEGKNLAIEYRWADGIVERLPARAAELVALNLDVIVVSGGSAAIAAAQNATRKIPIIFSGSSDPVASGFVASLARPGGNLTGVTIGGPELYGKRLELIKESVPTASRVGFLFNPSIPAAKLLLRETVASATAIGAQIDLLEVRTTDDFDGAFAAASRAKSGALSAAQSPPITDHRKRILDLAAKSRLPAIYADREWPDSGGLMSYGPNYVEQFRRAAWYVDKILKGTKPADLPVEQPMKFELVINLKAAKQIGLTIPPNVLVRADKVIK
jgi:putative ABC transport system substrate-binding protein